MLSEASRVPAAPALRPLMAPRASAEGRGLTHPVGDEPTVKKLGGLVLTRHLGESIMIGEEIEVQVVGLKFVAPRSIAVHRREVFDAIQARPSLPEAAPALAVVAPAPRPGKPLGGLVLTRSPQQSIMIGEEVELMVVEVRPNAVKLKISAPRSVAVHRREVFDAIRDGQV
jgi:carbon storage regulator